MNNKDITLKKTSNFFEKFLDWILGVLLISTCFVIGVLIIIFGFLFTILVALPLDLIFNNYPKQKNQ